MSKFLGSTGLRFHGQVQNDLFLVDFDPQEPAEGDLRVVIQVVDHALGVLMIEHCVVLPPGEHDPNPGPGFRWYPSLVIPPNIHLHRIFQNPNQNPPPPPPVPKVLVEGILLTNGYRDPNIYYEAFLFPWLWTVELSYPPSTIHYFKHSERRPRLHDIYQPPPNPWPVSEEYRTIRWGCQINQYRQGLGRIGQ
ncbi:hypothetical protein L218DRAFT_963164 [Marasmius fiardii PR-910]|nr:hypothetical protein L218DRAFT_963164 [Marasmius fiardii PR-910]